MPPRRNKIPIGLGRVASGYRFGHAADDRDEATRCDATGPTLLATGGIVVSTRNDNE